jgi:hypothetical protein
MIKRFFLSVLMVTAVSAEGPLFSHKDSLISQEFTNVYQDLKHPNISNGSATTFTITASTITSLHVGSITGFSVSETIKQVVSSRATSSTSSTSTSYVDTALSATITPTATSSTVLIIATGYLSANADSTNVFATLYRGSTNLASGALTAFCNHLINGGITLRTTCAMSLVDAPASTSALTYKVRIKTGSGASAVVWGEDNDTTLTLIEVGS